MVTPVLPKYSGDAVTRALCHAVHVDENLRRYVLRYVIAKLPRAVCPALGVDLIAVARHAVAAERRRTLLARTVVAVRLALPAGIGIGVAARSIVLGCGLAVAALLVAWGQTFLRVRGDRVAAVAAIRDPAPPAAQAPRLVDDAETRLADIGRANVIVYADQQFDPFIGSGQRLHKYQMDPIDVTRAAKQRSTPVIPFTSVELHHYLATEIPKIGFDGLRVRNRLYVRGDHALDIGGLVPDRYGPPVGRVAGTWVRAGADRPAERARTYLCMEHVLAGGDLVVSMYVRAKLEHDMLSIERIIYFLPPLRRRFLPLKDMITAGGVGAVVEGALAATIETLPLLVGRTTKHCSKDRFSARNRKRDARDRRAIRGDWAHDYGARSSLREAVAAYDTSEHFEESDVIDSAQRLQKRLLKCLERFLDDHGVDTAEFNRQVQMINTMVANIGTIQGNAAVGSNATVNVGDVTHGAVNAQQHPPAQPQHGSP